MLGEPEKGCTSDERASRSKKLGFGQDFPPFTSEGNLTGRHGEWTELEAGHPSRKVEILGLDFLFTEATPTDKHTKSQEELGSLTHTVTPKALTYKHTLNKILGQL